MMVTVGEIYKFLNDVAPFNTQEEWDNSGFLIGNANSEVKKVVFCLDATNSNLDKALEFGADLVVTHHPIIWDALKFLPSDTTVSKCVRNNINVISCHTNWDIAEGGVSDALATFLGLQDVYKATETGELSMVRIGTLPIEMTARELAELTSDALETVVAVTLPDKKVRKVAVCGGAGACFMKEIAGRDVDAFVTGEAKHNEYNDARDLGLSLLTGGHYETETISMPVLKALVEDEFPELDCIYFEDPPVEYIG